MDANAISEASPERARSGEPKRHHYVPVMLLARFTSSGKKDGLLWLHDGATGIVKRVRPARVGLRRQFYRVDAPGVEPNFAERLFAQIEGDAAPILAAMDVERHLPSEEAYNKLMTFLALLAARTPLHRSMLERNVEHFHRHFATLLLSRPGPFEEFREREKAAGREVRASRKEMLQFVGDPARSRIDVNPTYLVGLTLDQIDPLCRLFGSMSWSLVFTSTDHGSFVCSDAPVTISPTRPDAGPFVGYGSFGTELLVPLGRQIAIVGSLRGEQVVAQADSEGVAAFNRRVAAGADRFLFSVARDVLGLDTEETSRSARVAYERIGR